ncbi:MAG: hypothetical protein ACTHYO_14180 [Micrococcaceae bacterium]
MNTEIVPMPKTVTIAEESRSSKRKSRKREVYLMNLVDSGKPPAVHSHTVVIGGAFNYITVGKNEVEGIKQLTRALGGTTIESAMRRSRGAWLVVWPEEKEAVDE